MIADFRIALDNLAEGLGVHLPDLTDDEYLAVGEIMVREHGTTMSATFVDLNRIVNRVVDRRVKALPVCCQGRVYPGPSGNVKRHTCRGKRGQPFAQEFATMEKVAKVLTMPRRLSVHPPCQAAWDGGLEASVCWRCLPRLCEGDCVHDACRYAEAHLDDEDDVRGRPVV